ncbi:hypothetical protein [Ostreiculturibacter nitratireducens]|uniref:hypothetical protein n=1 Tax=Ostreiculturibacter nitratireducens TaxID=3075226 RepID=UPI0031B5D5E3
MVNNKSRFSPTEGSLNRREYFFGLIGMGCAFAVLGILLPLMIYGNLLDGAVVFLPVLSLFVVSIWLILTMRLRDAGASCPFCWSSAAVVFYTPIAAYAPLRGEVGYLLQNWPEIILAVFLLGVGLLRRRAYADAVRT